MTPFKALYRKELAGYFYSPVAYVFIIMFLLASVGSTFFLGQFFESGQASLDGFFFFHPWLYLFFIPAIGMGLWAEESNQGTLELLLTLPIGVGEAVMAKFLAAWSFISLGLALTFPLVLSVGYLGSPDYGVIATGYLGSFLMAGAFLAFASFTSSLTSNQVVSFILSLMVCLVLVLSGWGVFMDILNRFLPPQVTEWISTFSFTSHFKPFNQGVIDLRDLVFFVSFIGLSLVATYRVITRKMEVG